GSSWSLSSEASRERQPSPDLPDRRWCARSPPEQQWRRRRRGRGSGANPRRNGAQRRLNLGELVQLREQLCRRRTRLVIVGLCECALSNRAKRVLGRANPEDTGGTAHHLHVALEIARVTRRH